MTDMLFCYCCRVHHPRDQMRRFATRHGERWRCRRCIAAAGLGIDERDAFGRRQSKLNRLMAIELAERVAAPHLNIRQP
jgi:threonine aldolase